MVKFRHISEVSKKGPVMIFTGEMCEHGDIFSVEGEFLIAKARANDNCEEITGKTKQDIKKEEENLDDGQEIRDEAKSLGIKNYWNKKIPRLLEEIAELKEA